MDFGGSFSHNASNLAPQREEEEEEEEMRQRSFGTGSQQSCMRGQEAGVG